MGAVNIWNSRENKNWIKKIWIWWIMIGTKEDEILRVFGMVIKDGKLV